MPFLRQSTAQTVRFGPFLDITDGVTEEVTLTITQALMRLSKDGAAFAQKAAAGNATHDSDGWYSTSLDATDTDTVGELIMNVQIPATALPVWMRWWVLEEAVYDAMYGASAAGPLQSTVAGRTLDVTAAGEAGLDLDNTVGTIAAGQFAAGAITATVMAAGSIDASALSTSAVDEIRDAILNRVLSGNHDTGDTPGALLQILGDALTELAQAAPSATPTPVDALMLLYMTLRNKLDITATFLEIHNNAGIVITKKALTDDDTTYSEAEAETGP